MENYSIKSIKLLIVQNIIRTMLINSYSYISMNVPLRSFLQKWNQFKNNHFCPITNFKSFRNIGMYLFFPFSFVSDNKSLIALFF